MCDTSRKLENENKLSCNCQKELWKHTLVYARCSKKYGNKTHIYCPINWFRMLFMMTNSLKYCHKISYDHCNGGKYIRFKNLMAAKLYNCHVKIFKKKYFSYIKYNLLTFYL